MKKKNSDNRFQSKEIKRNKSINEDYKKVIGFLVVLVIIFLLLGLVYFLNGKFVTKDHFQDSSATTTSPKFDSSVILLDDMLKQGKSEYMVMIYDTKDENQDILYADLVAGYDDELVSLYTVDLSSAMNKKYYNKEGKENTKPTKISDIVITKPTLIVVKKGKISSYITDYDKISKKLL